MPVDFTFDLMSKDTGSSASDFVTKDGSANRKVEGTLSRALSSGETLQFWNGSAWVNASVTGLKWQAQDGTAHSASWEYKLRVIDAGGNTTPEQSQQVVLDVTASDVQVIFDHMEKDDGAAGDWKTSDGSAGRKVSGSLSKALSAGDVAEYSLDGGKTWQKLTVSGTSWSFTDTGSHSASWQYQVRIVDIAGNTSVPVQQTVTYVPPVSFKLEITEVWDNEGGLVQIPRNGTTDDHTPLLKGTGEPGEHIIFWIFDATNNKDIFMDGLRAVIKSDGTWELEIPKPLPAGEYSFTASYISSFVMAKWWNLTIVDEISVTITGMAKDTGSSASDFITKDGTAGRKVEGTLSRALASGEKLELWNGKKWVSASVTGLKWQAQDSSAHSASWEYKVRVVDSSGKTAAEKSQQVVLDTTPSDVKLTFMNMSMDDGVDTNDWKTSNGSAGRKVSGSLSKALDAGDVAEYSLDGGKTWLKLAVNGTSWSFTDTGSHSADWQYQVRITDIAGNVSAPVTQDVILEKPEPITFTFTRMDKDTGKSTTDFVTKDGTANRKVEGTLSRALKAGEKLELWDGVKWVAATANGLKWQAQDSIVHTGNWQYKLRVVDGAGNATPELSQQVVFDNKAPTGRVDISSMEKDDGNDIYDFITSDGSKGRKVFGWADKLNADEFIEYSLDGGKTWKSATMIHGGYEFKDNTAHSSSWEYQVRITDLAGNSSAPVKQAVTFVPPTKFVFTEAWDDEGTSVLAPQFATIDDNTPRFKGTGGEPGKAIVIWATNTGTGQQTAVGRGIANSDGTWEIELNKALKAGKYEFYAVYEASNIAAENYWHLTIVNANSITISSMEKDSGISQSDFITNDGSAGRQVSGSITKALTSGQKVQLWNGSAWVNATVNGLKWTAVDSTSHSGNWSYKARIIDGSNNVHAEKSQSVLLDKTTIPALIDYAQEPGTVKVTHWGKTNDSTPTLHGKVEPNAIVYIEFGLDSRWPWHPGGSVKANAKGEWEWTCPEKLDADTWDFQMKYTDIAGNASEWSPQFTLIIEKQADSGGGGDSGGGLEWGWGGAGNGAGDIKGFSEQNISLGINSLSLSGQEQSLNLADVHGHINRLDTVDITGSGDNHLTLSANDVLVLGEESLFIDDGKKQIQIKGNEGDSATLARQLDNFDSNDWRAEEGKITSAGVEYTVWHHQHSDAEVLIQVGIKTEFD